MPKTPNTPPVDAVALLLAVANRLTSQISQALAKRNPPVSLSQYQLVCHLAISPLNMSAVAGVMGHTTAAATGLVDRVEKRGFAKRVPQAGDRRTIVVEITDAGRALLDDAREIVGPIIDRLEKQDHGLLTECLAELLEP